MLTNLSVFLIMITLSSVAAQTFQYSRGWTNGKRDGRDGRDRLADRLEKMFTPCQMQKLRYLLDGKAVTEKLLTPCEYLEEDGEEPRRQKLKLAQDSLYDNIQ
ncbi:pro-corazonin-like [Aricia agestis]|uniref:pro-corazonin-like n=1 Tax=Aricia agestis TaxID=91739 RepID=UPI001C2035B9|nr:pro-corazonin-like [Aricia agestis]